MQRLTYGSVAARIASVSTHPLDVARTKLATDRWTRGGGAPRYVGTYGTLRRVFIEEGARGLMRGVWPAVLCNAPAAAMFFGVYKGVSARLPCNETCRNGTAAAVSWVVTCLALNPLFLLKIKQQTQLVRADRRAPLKYAGLFSSARVVLREQGIRGLYAGTLAACAGFPGAMGQMALYEYLKKAGSEPDAIPSTGRVAAASSVSSAAVGVAAYPLEVVRLRLQAQGPGRVEEQYSGIVDGFRKIFKNEGFRSFYRGCGTALIRSVPQSAIALSSFETILRFVTVFMEAVP